MLKNLILTAAPALMLAAPAIAQDAERMSAVVSVEADAGTFMGAVLVAKEDTLILNDAWGSADLEWSIDNSPLTKFRIGSVTKQFTAVSILLLQEQGKLDIDAPIATYLEDTPEAWDAITVRQLMRHTAGLPNVTSLEGFGRLKYLPTSQEDLVATFRDLPLEFAPGSKFAYSNSGYILLSAIVERVSEQGLGAFYQANIFDPLDMKETGLDDSSKILPRRADGYSPDKNGVVNADFVNMGIPSGAGALYSTTGDLLKWQRGLFGGAILSEASLAEYLSPSPHEAVMGNLYAHGVIVDESEDGTVYWHGGGIEGFNAWLGFHPEREVTVAVLANLNGGAARKIGDQLMTLVQGGEIVLPDERVADTIDAADLAQYEGVYALAPTFKITVTQDGETLKAQATGQNAFEIFPEGPDRFFYKVVDAQIRFERDDDGAVTSLTLFQGGQELPGVKE